MVQLAFLALAFGGVPAGMLAWQLRLIRLAGIPVTALAWYMLGMGATLAGWSLQDCLDGLRKSVFRIDETGRTVIESQACYSRDLDYFLATGLGMIVASAVAVTAMVMDRSGTWRRRLLAVAGLLSVSSIGYAISPIGLLVAGVAPLTFLYLAAKGWRLRPSGLASEGE